MTNICQASISGNVVDKTVSFNLPTEATEMVDKMQSIATLDRERKCALLRSEMKPENLGNKWMLRPSLTQRISCQPLKKNLNFFSDNTHGPGDRSQCLAHVWNSGHHYKKLVLRRATHIIRSEPKVKPFLKGDNKKHYLNLGLLWKTIHV